MSSTTPDHIDEAFNYASNCVRHYDKLLRRTVVIACATPLTILLVAILMKNPWDWKWLPNLGFGYSSDDETVAKFLLALAIIYAATITYIFHRISSDLRRFREYTLGLHRVAVSSVLAKEACNEQLVLAIAKDAFRPTRSEPFTFLRFGSSNETKKEG